MSDDESPSSPLRFNSTRDVRQVETKQTADDLIQDSEDEEERLTSEHIENDTNENGDDAYHSASDAPDNDEQYNDFSQPSPTDHKTKRRRISNTHLRRYSVGRTDADAISSASDHSNHDSSPMPSSPDEFATPPRRQIHSTPVPSNKPFPPLHSGTIESPRFMLPPPPPIPGSLQKKENISSASEEHKGSTIQSTPAHKPHFILPFSPPSTDRRETTRTTDSAQISPILSHKTRKTVRSYSSSADFVPNGAANNVRNWLLDLDARRQASQYITKQQRQTQSLHNNSSKEHFYFTATVLSIKHSPSLREHPIVNQNGSPAPMTLVACTSAPQSNESRDQVYSVSQQSQSSFTSVRKLLLFGGPISSQTGRMQDKMSLKEGDTVVVRRSLAWEIDIEVEGICKNIVDAEEEKYEYKDIRKWLVGVEWEILKRSRAR